MSLDRRTLLAALAAAPLSLHAGRARADAPTEGRLVEHPQMASAHAAPRDVTVWLPPGYDASDARWPVLYMHDGQNLFDGSRAAYGSEWGVDEHVARLGASGQIRTPIVVGVHNTPLRLREYIPANLIDALPDAGLRAEVLSVYGGEPLSDGYLRFLVEELKPFIDRTYRTRPGRDDTVIIGSSMGGLISLYALQKYPEVFSGAGCVSTHWPDGFKDMDDAARPAWQERVMDAWTRAVAADLPSPADHRLYFDSGVEMTFPAYAAFQSRIDATIRGQGWGHDRFRSLVFPGGDHNEKSWNQRFDVPLTFLLPPQ